MVAVYNFHFGLQYLPRRGVRLRFGRLIIIQWNVDPAALFVLGRFPQRDIDLRSVCQFNLFLKSLRFVWGAACCMRFPLFGVRWSCLHRIPQLALPIFQCSAVNYLPFIPILSIKFLLPSFQRRDKIPRKKPHTSALARRVTWQLMLTATGRQATWVGICSMQTPRQVVAPPKPCGPKPVALMASRSSFSSAA